MPIALPDRSCGTCTLCCVLPDIDELDKPANHVCRHCVVDTGCLAYADRPLTCRDFLCLWRTDASLDDHWHPERSHMMVYRQGAQITVLVDPRFSESWQAEPYLGVLRSWAEVAREDNGYLVVFIGDQVRVMDGR